MVRLPYLRALRLAVAALIALVVLPARPEAVENSEAGDPLVSLARVYGVVRYFHPSDSLAQVDWDRFLVFAAKSMDEASSGRETAARLESLFGPIVDGFRVAPAGAPSWRPSGEGAIVEWRHLGYGLERPPQFSPYVSWRTHHQPLRGGEAGEAYQEQREASEKSVYEEPVMSVPIGRGLVAQIPVSLPQSATRVGPAQQGRLDRLIATIGALPVADTAITRAQAAADGIAAWNMARHFYPYWDVVRVDWEGELARWLVDLPPAQSRDELADSLRRLTAPMNDGHVRIVDPKSKTIRMYLPISFRPAGDRWIVDATAVPERVKPGDVIEEIDGQPVEAWYAERAKRLSGSSQYKRWRARFDLMIGPKDTSVRFGLSRGADRFEERLAYGRSTAVQVRKPPAIHEIAPGIQYVDVARLRKEALEQSIEKLAKARGIVFDLRGTPTDESASIIPYWITGTDSANWMSVPVFEKPFGKWTRSWTTGWHTERNDALSKPAKVLLTDGRMISYLESMTGYFPGQHVGPIIGERTGGVNGNTVFATLPSGMRFLFTGMRVTRHDGSLLHLEGFAPDIEVIPTVEGLRAERDEALERAVKVLEAQPGAR